MLVSTRLSSFKHNISFAINLAATFGCQNHHTRHCVQAFARLHLKSLCCLIFESEQTPFSRTDRRFRFSALHRIPFGTCGFVPMWGYVIFLLSDEWMIERLSKAMGAALVGNNYSPIPLKNSFHMKKKATRCYAARNLQSIKTFWQQNWVSIARVVLW